MAADRRYRPERRRFSAKQRTSQEKEFTKKKDDTPQKQRLQFLHASRDNRQTTKDEGEAGGVRTHPGLRGRKHPLTGGATAFTWANFIGGLSSFLWGILTGFFSIPPYGESHSSPKILHILFRSVGSQAIWVGRRSLGMIWTAIVSGGQSANLTRQCIK